MYRDLAEQLNILFNKNVSSFNILLPAVLFVFLFILCCTNTFAQWVNNPAVNTTLVNDASDPINISCVRDLYGGAFVFWQDNRNGFQNEIYFVRINNEGKLNQLTGLTSSLEKHSGSKSEGRKITNLVGPEENPVCSNDINNSAVVLWVDYTYSKSGDLFSQHILDNGNLDWSDQGLQLTNTGGEISGYSVCSDNNGSSFVAYVSKNSEINGSYEVNVQKISPNGKILFTQNTSADYKYRDRKSMTKVVPDYEGGVYVFWIETQNSKSVIVSQHVNEEGKVGWESGNLGQPDKLLEISGNTQNVITYIAKSVNGKSVYIAWQSQKTSKDIYHQILDNKGRLLWGRSGKHITSLKGNQINPQSICTDSTIILSWTNEQLNNSDIYIQKYNLIGKPLWGKTGIPMIKYPGEQFGQKIVSDGKDGAIVSWIDRRDESALADIYAQRVDSTGKIVWDSIGVAVAINHNTPKSYLSLISDDVGGAVVIFKNNRSNKSKIYGQKILGSGDYISQIESLNTTIIGDSIKISWNAIGGQNHNKFNVERAIQTQDDKVKWLIIGSVSSLNKNLSQYYEYFDIPSVTGTLYYRITQTDAKGNVQNSDVSRINYFGGSSDVIVTQNIPNPFIDSTVISFYLPNPSMVEIEFFNDHVDKISELDKSFPAGENSITFYSKGLKTGIYFYRLKVDNFVDVKKMIITN